MADPFSIATGVVGLIEAGTALSKTIYDLTSSYKASRSDMLELASEIDLITSLFNNLGVSMDRAPDLYSEDFQRMTRNLIIRCRRIFDEIGDNMPGGMRERGVVELKTHEKLAWAAFTKDKVLKKQKDLRSVQHMFTFVETMQRYIEKPDQRPKGQNQTSSITIDPNSNFTGTFQQTSENGNPVTFQATLTLQPIEQPTPRTYTEEIPIAAPEPVDSRRDDRVRLENMRMSPYFEKNMLEDPPPGYGEVTVPEDRSTLGSAQPPPSERKVGEAVPHSDTIAVSPPHQSQAGAVNYTDTIPVLPSDQKRHDAVNNSDTASIPPSRTDERENKYNVSREQAGQDIDAMVASVSLPSISPIPLLCIS